MVILIEKGELFMKKILFIFSCIVLFLLGILVFIGYSFNSENYKNQFVSTLSNMTGRKVEVADLSLTWTPFPTMLISNLSISNQEESKVEKMFTSEKVYVEISWASLFKNPLVIKKVTFQKPTILLERIKSYQTNFDFPYLFNLSKNLTEETSLMGRGDFSLKIREFIVEDGRVTYSNILSGENYSVSGIFGTGSLLSLNGPFSFEGRFSMGDSPKKVSLQIGQIEVSQNLPLKILFSDEKSMTKITSEGEFLFGQKTTKEWFKLPGIITSQNPRAFFESFGLSDWPEGTLVGSFTLNVMPNKTIFENITLSQEEGDLQTAFFLGKQEEKEDASRNVPILIVKNMDYKNWRPVFKSLLKVPFFDQLKTKFYLQLEGIKLNGQTVEVGNGHGAIEKGILSFEDLLIKLPYSGALSFKGEWDLKKNSVNTDLELQTNDFSSTVLWGLPKIASYPSVADAFAKIQDFHFSGHFQMDGEKFSLETESAVFDGTTFLGQIKVDFSKGLNVNANLNVAHLNVDSFFVIDSPKLTNLTIPEGNYLFDFKGQDITANDHHFEYMNIKGEVVGDKLTLNDFLLQGSEDFSLKGKGTFQKFGKKDFSIDNLDVNYSISDLKKFIKEMKASSDNPFVEKGSSLKGNLIYSGNLLKGKIQTTCQLEQAQIKLTGSGEKLLSMAPQFQDVDFSLTYPDAQLFLSLFGDDLKTLFPFLKGDIKVQAKGKGTFGNFEASQFDLNLGKQDFSGNASWNLIDHDMKFDLKTPKLDLNYFLPSKEELYPFNTAPIVFNVKPEWAGALEISANQMLYDGQRYKDISSKLILKGQELNIPYFKASSEKGDEKISFDGNVTFRTPFVIEGNYNITNFNLKNALKMASFSFSGGKGNLSGNFATSGSSTEELIRNLAGEGLLDWKNGSLRGIDIHALSSFTEKVFQHTQQESAIPVQLKHALSSGKTDLSSISAPFVIKKGEVTIEEAKAQTVNASVYFRKLGWSLFSGKFNFLLSVLLNKPENLPSLEFAVTNENVTNKVEAFEESLHNEIRRFLNQKKEAIERKNKKETEDKKEELLAFANQTLEQAEYLMKQLQDRMALDPSLKSEDLIYEAEKNIQEVRQLVVRSELNKEQMLVLDEKSKLLEIQLRELEYLLKRQEVSRQKNAMNKLPPLVERKLNDIVQIYRKNPNSSFLIALIQGVQKEEKEIKSEMQSLSRTVDVEAAEEIILKIKESFEKIQKAWDYAQKMDSKGEIAPSVSGTILGKEI